nr:MAG TPA: Plasmid recombination enzyme-DNA complex, Pfam Family [Caudoviricetes sp.]
MENTTITLTTQAQTVTPGAATSWANHSRNKTRNANHKTHNENIDLNETKNNKMILDELDVDGVADRTISDFVDELYQEDVERYNDNRVDKRPSREIHSYAKDRLEVDRRQKEPYVEMVFAIGSSAEVTKDGLPHYHGTSDSGSGSTITPSPTTTTTEFANIDRQGPEWSARVSALEEFGNKLPGLLQNFKFYYIALHVDETNPHLHAGAVPFYSIDEQNNKTNKSQLIKHQSGVSNAFIRTADELGLPIAQNKQGKPIATSAFKEVVDGYLKTELLQSYRTAKNDHTIKRAEPRPKRPKLSMQEYRKLVKPITDIAQEMAQRLEHMNNALSSLEGLYEHLDDAGRILLDDIKNTVREDEDGSADMLSRLSEVQRAITIQDEPSSGSSDDDIIQSIDLDEIIASIDGVDTISLDV